MVDHVEVEDGEAAKPCVKTAATWTGLSLQHDLVVPQHHFSDVGRPSHGVIWTFLS